MKVMTLQNHYNMNIIKYKVKYILYLKILLGNKKEAAYCYFGVKRVYFESTKHQEYKTMNTHSSGYYSIDKDYNILSYNDTAKQLYPNLQPGVKCYKALMGLDSPCPPCPVALGDAL